MSFQNPQVEDGYTPVANTIMEALARTRLSGNEWRVLMFLLRNTYGWSKKSDLISLSQFVSGTGMCQRRVIEAINSLIDKNVIKKASAEKRRGERRKYEFNKRFSSWGPLRKSADPLRKSAEVNSDETQDLCGNPHMRKSAEVTLELPPTTIVSGTENISGSVDIAPTLCGNPHMRKSAETISRKILLKKEEVSSSKIVRDENSSIDEVPPDLPELRKPSKPYELALWFYESRGIPAKPTPMDMRNFKQLLEFYDEDVIKKGIAWRLEHDPEGFWSTHITSVSVYRNFGNWMAESTKKAEKFDTWLDKNPSLDYRKLSDVMARADGFMRAFQEAKKNPLVYFDDNDYTSYRKCIRIKTREAHDELKEGRHE